MKAPAHTGPFLLHGVKYLDGEFYLRCARCRERHQGSSFWPLTLEFWDPNRGMARCRACWIASRKQYERSRQRRRESQGYYRNARDVILAKKRAYYEEHADEMRAKKRAKYAAIRAAQGKPYNPVGDHPDPHIAAALHPVDENEANSPRLLTRDEDGGGSVAA